MKNIKLLAGIALLVAASSCTKIKEVDNTPVVNKPTNFKEIKVNDNFTWNTTNNISLDVQGFSSVVPIKNTFIVSSEDQKDVYFASNTLMSDNFKAEFALPIHAKKIKVNFGTITKVLDVNSNNLTFDYLMPAPTEEVQ
ncbi:MAG: hypothetical protein ACEQSR_10780 [Candidatus Methylacidiphilales bacterium]